MFKKNTSNICVLFLVVAIAASVGIRVAAAFTGPTTAPGVGSGAFSVDANSNLGFGVPNATPTTGVFGKVFMIGSSGNPGIALQNTSAGGRTFVWYSEIDTGNGKLSLWDVNASARRITIDEQGYLGVGIVSPGHAIDVVGNVRVTGAFIGTFSGTISAGNVTSGVFGINQGTTSYAFPSALGVGTTTTAGLPANGLYVAGSVGIGTANTLHALEFFPATVASGGIGFGTDTELYRSGANTLALASGDVLNIVNGSLQVGGTAVVTSGRIVQSANGSSSTPAFAFSSDTNTGLYSGGADILRLVTGGADQVNIDALGKVGIATSTPTQKLEVVGKVKISGAGNSLIFPDASEQTTAFLGVGQEVTAARVSQGVFGSLTSGHDQYIFKPATDATSVLRVETAGGSAVLNVDTVNQRVGIGTTWPDSVLHVSKSNSNADTMVHFQNAGSGTATISLKLGEGVPETQFAVLANLGIDNSSRLYAIAPSESKLAFHTGLTDYTPGSTSNERMVILDSGNIGIGTTGPGAKLDIYNNVADANLLDLRSLYTNNANSYGGRIRFIDTAGGTVVAKVQGIHRNVSGNFGLAFFTNGENERMYINQDGNVGIGTASPGAKLDVSFNTDNDKAILVSGVSNQVDGMYLDKVADVARNWIAWHQGSGSADWRIGMQQYDFGIYNAAGGAATPSSPGTAYLTIQQTTGNLGIATSTPTQKLEVVGKVKISGTGNSLIFPDASEQTTAFLGTGQEVTAARVSSGGFGTLSTKGNYWFEHFNSSAPVLYVDALNDRVGIGTTGPGTKLQIGTSVASAFPTLGTASGHLSLTGNGALWGMYAGLDDSGKGWIQQMRNDGATAYDLSLQPVGGNVGIGTTGPVHKLELATDTTAIGGIGFGTDTELYRSGANTLALASGDVLNIVNGSLQIGGTAVITSGRIVQSANGSIGAPAFTFSSDTNTGFYSGGADTLRLVTGGADRMSVDAAGNVSIAGNTILNGTLWLGGAMASSINLNSNDITNVNKLTVTTIDPVYEINNKKYATYVSDTIGLKVEYYGKAALTQAHNSQLTIRNNYSYVIDFTKLAEGSDLWLFWQTSDEGENMRDIVVTLTPEGGNATLWYELKPKERQIVIYGDMPVVFSYELIAPRHDAKQWPTITKESSQGTKLRVK